MSLPAKKLRVWVIKIGEVVPAAGGGGRVLRAGQIALRLHASGAEVRWFVGDYDHQTKQYLEPSARPSVFAEDIALEYLHGRPYGKNVSVTRILNHLDVAADFAARARVLPRPDVIFCALPTIELSYEAVRFGREFGVPVVVDVRDMWPDIFEDLLPLPRWLSRLLLLPLARKTRVALCDATMVTAITEPFLAWAMQRGERQRRPQDRAVHLAYQRRSFTPAEIGDAEAFWHGQGLRLDGSEKIACYFTNLSGVPQFDNLIATLDHLAAEIAGCFRLVICGDGPRLRELQGKAKLRSPQLLVPGFVNHARMVSLMRHSFVGLVAYPPRRDYIMSYPNKIGEYLSEGLPIIVTFPGVAADLLTQNGCGIALPSADPVLLANAFALLAGSQALDQSRKAASLLVFSKYFDADTIYGSYTDALLELARQCGSAS
jgi:glycosyltransferase involved in cell wall biosynthesis